MDFKFFDTNKGIYVMTVGVILLPTFLSAVSFYPNLPVHGGMYVYALLFNLA